MERTIVRWVSWRFVTEGTPQSCVLCSRKPQPSQLRCQRTQKTDGRAAVKRRGSSRRGRDAEGVNPDFWTTYAQKHPKKTAHVIQPKFQLPPTPGGTVWRVTPDKLPTMRTKIYTFRGIEQTPCSMTNYHVLSSLKKITRNMKIEKNWLKPKSKSCPKKSPLDDPDIAISRWDFKTVTTNTFRDTQQSNFIMN